MSFLGGLWAANMTIQALDAEQKRREAEQKLKSIQKSTAERVRLNPVEPDCRGYTDRFECTGCGCIVHIGTYEKECDYDFCPYCGKQT